MATVKKPRRYLFSFTGLIDASAVLFFFVPQVRSELLLWVFKFGRILRVFKLLKFIDEARVLGQALRGSSRTIGVFLFFVFLLQAAITKADADGLSRLVWRRLLPLAGIDVLWSLVRVSGGWLL